MKQFFSILLLLFTSSFIYGDILNAPLPADSPLTQLHSKVDKKKKKTHERGIFFDGLDKNSTIVKSAPKSQKRLLEELVKIAKEQLDVQKKILKEVRLIRKPAPEKIIVNGKECIANSSFECFQMPLTPTAQKIPVYKNWLRNPNEKNSLALTRWESKYFNQISKSAHSRDFVITKYGDKALKTSFNRSGFDSIGGTHKVVRKKNTMLMLNKISKSVFDVYLFFGKNPELDYQSFGNYSRNMRELDKVDYNVVFYTQGSREALEDSAKVFPELKKLLGDAKSIVTSKELFIKGNIYATPTIAIKLKKNGSIEPISVGNYFSGGVQQRIMKMLVMKNIVKPEHSPDYKMFDRASTVGSEYVQRYYGKDLNMTKIKQLYRKGVKQ